MADYESVATRWRDRQWKSDTRGPLKNERMLDRGDIIYSYGTHFELARVLRDKQGHPRGWLQNGDRWPGPTTTKHQGIVRDVLDRGMAVGMPNVTIPHEVLRAARVDLNSIELIETTGDVWLNDDVVRTERPGTAVMTDTWGKRSDPPFFQNTLTGEVIVKGQGWEYGQPHPHNGCERPEPSRSAYGYTDEGFEAYRAEKAAWDTHVRLRHGVWDWHQGAEHSTGRKELTTHGGNRVWEMVNEPSAPDGMVYIHRRMKHRLGESLIKAKVTYRAWVKCKACNGTGQTELRIIPRYRWHGSGIGPLTEEDMARFTHIMELLAERGSIQDLAVTTWEDYEYIPLSDYSTVCDECSGRRPGKIEVTKERWAYFLSGFDANETTPSYFFCELPRKAKPATVAEAYEALKPDAVKLAEDMGRVIERQGDIFAIEVTGLTTRDLKKMGGVQLDDPFILTTNHKATDVIIAGAGLTYVRGSLTHAPQGRRPDHRRIKLGDGKTWFLAVKNTVPLAS